MRVISDILGKRKESSPLETLAKNWGEMEKIQKRMLELKRGIKIFESDGYDLGDVPSQRYSSKMKRELEALRVIYSTYNPLLRVFRLMSAPFKY